VPTVSPGQPAAAEQPRYRVAAVDGVRVHYPASLGVRPGFAVIRVKLRRLLFWRWLELEGARAVAEMGE
jgi:hypothetical protein